MDLRRIDLNGLVTLDMLLTECSVTRAAERLGIGQPAASTALAKMRKHFDDQLLVKEGRTLVRTPLAESLMTPLREALETIDDLMSRPDHFDPSTANRSFTVVASEYVSAVFLNRVMAHLQRQAPGIRINIAPISYQFADHLRKAEATFLVVPRELMNVPHEFSTMPMFSDTYVGMVWTEHPTVGDRLTAQQMAELPYIMYDPPRTFSLAEKQLDELGIGRNVEVATTSLLAAPFMLPGTLMYALIHRRLAERFKDVTDVRTVEPDVPLRPIQENLYWPRRLTNDPAHAWLRGQFAEVAASLHPEYQ